MNRPIIVAALWIMVSMSGCILSENGDGSSLPSPSLSHIDSWMYQLENLSDPEAVDALASSKYPLLVIDPTYTQNDERDLDIGAILDELRYTPEGKKRLILAYVNIGQAETYRTYWQPDWQAPQPDGRGNPDFLLAGDPDGWSDNYLVAFWDERWQGIWLGEEGLIGELARRGFDGVYLDWIGAYEEEPVVEASLSAGLDPAREMVDFIAAIRTAGRAIDEDFLVVGQNAPYLIDERPEFAGVIDALAVEDTWFSGTGDAQWGTPEAGDIPNQRQDEFSTTSLLVQYRKYQAQGLPVFSVDYCRSPTNATRVYQAARNAGLIPLVTQVSLSRLTETPPW